MFYDVRVGWLDSGPIPHEKMELEHVYFYDSNFTGNILGFNPNAGLVYPEVTRKIARRPTSIAPTN